MTRPRYLVFLKYQSWFRSLTTLTFDDTILRIISIKLIINSVV